jgi:hypothetical protein
VGQACRSLRFHAELGHKLLVRAQFRLQNLHGNKTVQLVIARAKYIRHSAGSYAIDYLISILKKIACIQHEKLLVPCTDVHRVS